MSAVGAPLTITNAFERVARWYGREEAVVDSVSRLNFAELDRMSRRAAALFAEAGAVAGEPVALLLAPTSVYLVAWLGVLRLGALPTVLHTRESAETLAQVCDRIGPTLLIYDASMEKLATKAAGLSRIIRTTVRARSALSADPDPAAQPVATIPDDLDQFPLDVPLARPAEDDPAIISLSSGTTSVAKGVVHTHRSLTELARTCLYLYAGLRPGDRSLVPLSTAFIGCTNGWLPFLNAGATTVFLEQFDLDKLIEAVPRERISHVFLTPTLWRRLLNSDIAGIDFSSVRLAGFAAEVMDAATLERLRDRVTPNVVQMYGSTETGAAAACIWAEEMVGERLTSVGRPMVNGDLRVVTPGGDPSDVVKPGETGEILVSNPSLAIGIWRDAEKTAESFVEFDGRRWWRSRDLGRLDAEGFLTIEGRHDDMIISGGINIMPARVEDCLMTHPGVAECAVVGVPNPDWGEEVRAYVVARAANLDAATLDRHVQDSALSAYQRPRRYEFVDELPRTATNKINRRALRAAAIAAEEKSNA